MLKRLKRLLIGAALGAGAVVAGIWFLSVTLGNNQEVLYQGKSCSYWREQLNKHEPDASNQAKVILNARIIPQLTDKIFHDTNDSSFRMALVEKLNVLPGVFINYNSALSRRVSAANDLGEFGPAAKAAIPVLLEAVKGRDEGVRGPAAEALGKIHGDPDVVIPVLIALLDDKDLSDEAAAALGNYGGLSKAAVPKLIPMLKIPDKDVQVAVRVALKKIDPEAAAKAGVK